MKTIDLITPKCWEMLTDNQLRYVFGLIAQGFTAVEVKTYCLIRWSGMQYNPLRLACRGGQLFRGQSDLFTRE